MASARKVDCLDWLSIGPTREKGSFAAVFMVNNSLSIDYPN